MGDQKAVGKLSSVFSSMKPYLAMISLQFGFSGMYIIAMVSLKRGMSNFVFVFYRHVVATIVITPFALVLERKTRPKMTLSVFLKLLLLGLLEPVLDQNLYFLGMKYTSATFASATVNALPAITFLLAIILRLEKVYWKKMHSLAKVIGTVITVTGATVMTLYKGPILNILWYSRGGSHEKASSGTGDQHWIAGTIMLLLCTCSWAGFFILQSFTLRQYPAQISLAMWICAVGVVQTGVVALVMERDMSGWTLGWDTRLLSAVYSGIVCSGVAYYVQGVVNKERGPVFVTAFSPLLMIITAVLGAIVLAEQVHLGSLIGAVIIVVGLYTVVWGKSKDVANPEKLTSGKDEGHELPIVDINARSDIVDEDNNGPIRKPKPPIAPEP